MSNESEGVFNQIRHTHTYRRTFVIWSSCKLRWFVSLYASMCHRPFSNLLCDNYCPLWALIAFHSCALFFFIEFIDQFAYKSHNWLIKGDLKWYTWILFRHIHYFTLILTNLFWLNIKFFLYENVTIRSHFNIIYNFFSVRKIYIHIAIWILSAI